MLNYHGELPPKRGHVSLLPEAKYMVGPLPASTLGKFVASSLVGNGVTSHEARVIMAEISCDSNFPHQLLGDEQHHFNRSGEQVIRQHEMASEVAA